MFYEISREVFKQRVETPLEFAIIDLTKGGAGLKVAKSHVYNDEFVSEFQAAYPDKNQNILLFSYDENDSSPKVAGKKLVDSGYQLVYYYLGNKVNDELIGAR